MTQFVFLLFEDVQVPADSKGRYRVEVHFSPGAKEREDIIFSGETIRRALDTRKNNVRLKRMLPAVRDDVVGENLSLSNMPAVKAQKRTSKSLPTLMTKEELKMVRNKATHISIFEDEGESHVDKPPSVPLLQNDIEFQSNSDNITIEELCKFLCILIVSSAVIILYCFYSWH